MRFFGFLDKYVDSRIDNFMEGIDMKYDVTGRVFNNDENFEIAENKVWYHGNVDSLLRFYKTSRPFNRIYQIADFYRLTPLDYPISHYPLADMISKTMCNLVFSEQPEITAQNENGDPIEEVNDVIKDIYNDNKFANMLQKAAEMESYSGAVAFKPVLDPDVSEFPIIIPYPKEDFEVIKKYDRPVAVVFQDHYKKGKDEYILYTECGKGLIDYKLVKCTLNKNKIGKQEVVPLNTLPETAGLKKLEFYGSDGQPLKTMLCVYKENKTGAISDYKGIIDDFSILDEILSNLTNFIRKSKVKVYMPENMCKKIVSPITKHVEVVDPGDFHSDVTILYDNNPENATQECKRDVVEINNTIDGYTKAFEEVLKHACLTTGLSLATIGYDAAGANASGEALSIREKVSMRTRSEKIHRWDEALQELTKLVLMLNGANANENKVYLNDKIDFDILVSFAEYEAPTFDAIVESLAAAKEAGLVDTMTALKKLWGNEISEDEIELMKKAIENEKEAEMSYLNDENDFTETKEENSEE